MTNDERPAVTTDDSAPQEPTTEAGRALLDRRPSVVDVQEILAIEAEARTETTVVVDALPGTIDEIQRQARADALREAAERVRGLPSVTLTNPVGRDPSPLEGTLSLAAVLAILDPEPAPWPKDGYDHGAPSPGYIETGPIERGRGSE